MPRSARPRVPPLCSHSSRQHVADAHQGASLPYVPPPPVGWLASSPAARHALARLSPTPFSRVRPAARLTWLTVSRRAPRPIRTFCGVTRSDESPTVVRGIVHSEHAPLPSLSARLLHLHAPSPRASHRRPTRSSSLLPSCPVVGAATPCSANVAGGAEPPPAERNSRAPWKSS